MTTAHSIAMKEKTRQALLAQSSNHVYVPKIVALALGIEWEHVSIHRAQKMGAKNIHIKEKNNGMVAQWPQFFFDLAARVEKTFAENQYTWQHRDVTVLQAAVKLHMAGRGDEALAMCSEHTGVPKAEMPTSFLEQVMPEL
jgi:hypothetical protein